MAHTAEILLRAVMECPSVTVRNINGTAWLYDETTMSTATVESVKEVEGGGYRILHGNPSAPGKSHRMDYQETINALKEWGNAQ